MNKKVDEISEKHFRTKYEQLGKREKKVANHLAERTTDRETKSPQKDFLQAR